MEFLTPATIPPKLLKLCPFPMIRLCEPVVEPAPSLYPMIRFPLPLTVPLVEPLPLRTFTLQPLKKTSVPTCEAHGRAFTPLEKAWSWQAPPTGVMPVPVTLR